MYKKPIYDSCSWVLPESSDGSRKSSIWAGLSPLLFSAANDFLNFSTLDISLQNKVERDTIFPLGDPVASHEYTKAESTPGQHSGEKCKVNPQPADWPLNTQMLGNALTTE